jgi:hypothetical protein
MVELGRRSLWLNALMLERAIDARRPRPRQRAAAGQPDGAPLGVGLRYLGPWQLGALRHYTARQLAMVNGLAHEALAAVLG